MKLNHLNLVVVDVAQAVTFFETYFDFLCTEVKGDDKLAVLKGTDDFTLVLMIGKKEELYPGAFHIGFMLPTVAQVDTVYRKLVQGNISLGQEPRKMRDSYGFYFHFEHIMIEVGHYVED